MRNRQESMGRRLAEIGALASCFLLPTARVAAQLGGPPVERPAAEATDGAAAKPAELPAPAGAKPLPPPDKVWIDPKNHEVLIDGYVALREGYLEMFACPVGTKEHESVIAVQTKAATVHAALLAVGAIVGRPVHFKPEFGPPEGTEIEIEVRWLDDAGKWQSARAQEWIREVESKKEMSHGWVFAGSGFWTDENTGKRYYMAEVGDFICVSNFTTAMLDVPFESSQSNEARQFEAFTDRIPKLGTAVRLVLKPVQEKEKEKPKDEAAK